jgi:hypothetical protein
MTVTADYGSKEGVLADALYVASPFGFDHETRSKLVRFPAPSRLAQRDVAKTHSFRAKLFGSWRETKSRNSAGRRADF